jgi:hypothetical protein
MRLNLLNFNESFNYRRWTSKLFKKSANRKKTLVLILLSQIRKFLKCASLQIFMSNPQFANSQFSTKYCTPLLSQNSHKSRFCKRFLCTKYNYLA